MGAQRRMLEEAHPHMRHLHERKLWGAVSSWCRSIFGGSSSPTYTKAELCLNGDTELTSDRRWEYTSCSCRWRFWNCGQGKAKHVRRCQEPNGDEYGSTYETCQKIPDGTPA